MITDNRRKQMRHQLFNISYTYIFNTYNHSSRQPEVLRPLKVTNQTVEAQYGEFIFDDAVKETDFQCWFNWSFL